LTCDSERPARLKSILCADAVSAETKAIENNTCLFMFYLKFESYLSIILLKHKTENIKLKNDEQKMFSFSCRFADGAFKPGAAG
jgi:hypothetical protein